jgi:hypothetical protein
VENCSIKGNRELVKRLPPHKSLFHRPEHQGLPVGNLTSQFFANVYLNELDQFVKHTLKFRYYVRYCDDFLLFSEFADALDTARNTIDWFLDSRLALSLNDQYARIDSVRRGIDFLGYIIRPRYLLVRNRAVNHLKTRLREFEKRLVSVSQGFRLVHYHYELLEKLRVVIASYFGHFKWANTHRLKESILARFGFLRDFFSVTERGLTPRYDFKCVFRNIRRQYHYFCYRFKGCAVFMQVGKFYEFYGSLTPVPEMLGLRPLKPNRRKAKYGFPLAGAKKYAAILDEKGMPVVFVMERDRRYTRIKCRMPAMKLERVT